MSDKSVETRLRTLEDVEAIRVLKARYLACCDAKDVAGFRACFADGEVAIDYGAIGKFDRADKLAEVYRQAACHDHMVEMHHGVNPRIEVTGADRARGTWGLHYQLLNTKDRTLTQLGGHYEDEYLRTPGGWRIVATRFVVTSTLVLQLGDAPVQAVFAGRAPPAPA